MKWPENKFPNFLFLAFDNFFFFVSEISFKNMNDPFKCILIEGSGGYDKLKQITVQDFEEASKKDLGKSISLVVSPGHVLIRTHAVGVNYADVCVRMGNQNVIFNNKACMLLLKNMWDGLFVLDLNSQELCLKSVLQGMMKQKENSKTRVMRKNISLWIRNQSRV